MNPSSSSSARGEEATASSFKEGGSSSSSSQQSRINTGGGSGRPRTPPRTNTTKSGRNTAPTTTGQRQPRRQQDDEHLPTAEEPKANSTTTTTNNNNSSLPMPLHLLLQTAYFGIDATARLSRPTLDISLKVLGPMLAELISHYVPSRITSWLSVCSTYVKNIWNLLRSTDVGRTLLVRGAYVGEGMTDVVGSDLGRQCVIDGTILLIRLSESAHTPEFKRALDQGARLLCRIVDVLACGKAKASYYELVELAWAAIETGNDEAMITSLAEGCAQICHALENEHLTTRRSNGRAARGAARGDAAAAAAAAKLSMETMSKRRRERDRRQLGTYPPGRHVASDYEAAGKKNDDYQDAWNDGFNIKDGDDDRFGGWVPLQEETSQEGLYADMENIPINEEKVDEDEDEKNGLPKIVLTNSFEMNHQLLSPKVKDDNKLPRVESDITTEMEDLHCSGVDNNEPNSESGLLPTKVKGGGKSIQYEQGDDDQYANNDNEVNQSNDDNDNDNNNGNNNMPTFDESIQQFYRRMNEVLVETRKQSKLQYNSSRVDKLSKEDKGLVTKDKTVQSNTAPLESSSSTVLTGGNCYNIYLLLILGVASMCTLWFTLGCYGFYVLVLGGGSSSRRQVYLPPAPAHHGKNPELASNIIIQIVTPETMDGITTGSKNSWWSTTTGGNKNNNGGVVSITLEDWKKVQHGVASAMAGEL